MGFNKPTPESGNTSSIFSPPKGTIINSRQVSSSAKNSARSHNADVRDKNKTEKPKKRSHRPRKQKNYTSPLPPIPTAAESPNPRPLSSPPHIENHPHVENLVDSPSFQRYTRGVIETGSFLYEGPRVTHLKKPIDLYHPQFAAVGELGSESYDCVYLAHHIKTGMLVVVKQQGGYDATRAHSEARLMKTLVHRHIVRYVHSWTVTTDAADPTAKILPGFQKQMSKQRNEKGGSSAPTSSIPNMCMIAMEYCPGGTLQRYIRKRREAKVGPIPPSLIARWVVQIANALFYCHMQHIFHRDLKPGNVLLQGENCNLSDFGLSRVLSSTHEFAQTQLGAMHYIPPEIYHATHYNNRADMWALGVMMYEMMTLRLPFHGTSSQAIATDIANSPTIFDVTTRSLYPHPLVDLCARLLLKNPKERLSAKEVLSHTAFVHWIPRIYMVPDVSADERARETAAWLRISVDATHHNSHMLVLKSRFRFRVNVREQPYFNAFIVQVLHEGDSVEQLRRIQCQGHTWIETPNGYCIAHVTDPKGKETESLFRLVPEWRIRRPRIVDDGQNLSDRVKPFKEDVEGENDSIPIPSYQHLEQVFVVLDQATNEPHPMRPILAFLTQLNIPDEVFTTIVASYSSMAVWDDYANDDSEESPSVKSPSATIHTNPNDWIKYSQASSADHHSSSDTLGRCREDGGRRLQASMEHILDQSFRRSQSSTRSFINRELFGDVCDDTEWTNFARSMLLPYDCVCIIPLLRTLARRSQLVPQLPVNFRPKRSLYHT